jgi:hypothetical protein
LCYLTRLTYAAPECTVTKHFNHRHFENLKANGMTKWNKCLIHCWSTQILWSETIVAVYTAVYFAEGPPFPGRRSVNGCLTTQQRRSASPAQNHASPSLSSERVLDAKTVPACPALCRAVLPRFKPCVPRPALFAFLPGEPIG